MAKIEIITSGDYPIARCTTKKERQCLIGISDAHVGSSNFDAVTLKRVVDYAVKNDAIVFLNGDLIENATRISVGAGVYEQVLPPDKQIDLVVSLLAPLPKSNIIGGVFGNHEQRTMKASGIDPTKIICDRLGVPYFGSEIFAIITKERESAFTLYATHSVTSSSSRGGTYNSVESKWFKFIDADIVAKGHGHDMGLDGPYETLKVDANNVSVATRDRWILLTGNYLSRPQSYATEIPVGPKPRGTVAAWLDMRKGKKNISGEIVR